MSEPNAAQVLLPDATIRRVARIFAESFWSPVLGVLLAIWLLSVVACITGGDSSDRTFWRRSGAGLVIDAATGCHYLRAPAGGITPRLDVTGRQICSGWSGEEAMRKAGKR